MRACKAIYAVEIFKFQQGEDAMLPYYIFFLPDLFIIHYSLFTNSVGRHVLQTKKERRATDLVTRLITPGNVLLSHGRLPQYPRRWGSSLPCSEWKRVLHPRYGHQAKVFCF